MTLENTLIALIGTTRKGKDRSPVFPPHLPLEQVEARIEEGSLMRGILRISKSDRQEAYITPEGTNGSADVYIPTLQLMNRALDGDVVAFEHLDGTDLDSERQRYTDKRAVKNAQDMLRQQKCDVFQPSSSEESETTPQADRPEDERTFGRVVAILKYKGRQRTIIGTLHMEKPIPSNTTNEINKSNSTPFKNRPSRYVWFRPMDRRIPFMLISREVAPKDFLENPSTYDNMLLTAIIRSWENTDNYPMGLVTGRIGQIGQLPAESQALLAAAGVTWDDFDDATLECLPSVPWKIPPEEEAKRIDMRGHRVFSIDPESSRVLDDALSCVPLPNGNFEIGVHIADVSYFVKPNTALDDEAMNRATSVYLVQRVIPMLPRLLCEELCSLNPGVDRLSFSVFWTFSPDGDIIGSPRFGRSIIKSCGKLSYEHAQAVIEGKLLPESAIIHCGATKDQVEQDILQLYKFSKVLRQRRYDNGALMIQSIRLWFRLDEHGNPVYSGVYELKDSNRMIEEFMLLANIAVAEKICGRFPKTALLRQHSPPVPRPLEEFRNTVAKFGFDIDTTSSKTLHASFEAVQDPWQRTLLRFLCLKAMKRALYFCSGVLDESSYSHYALSVPLYTHFTSPIRRYCDLVVHRLLNHALSADANSTDPYTTEQVSEFAEQCNDRKNAARDAQDASSKLYLCVYLSRLEQDVPQVMRQESSESEKSVDGILAEAFVNRIGTRSFDVVVPKYGIEKRVWVEDAIEAGEAIGVQTDQSDVRLKVYWRRQDGDLYEVDPCNDLASAMDALTLGSASDLRTETQQEQTDAVAFDPSKTKIQIIEMFMRVVVRIQVDVQRSPPDIKLRPVYPWRGLAVPEPRLKTEVATEEHLSVALPPAELDAD